MSTSTGKRANAVVVAAVAGLLGLVCGGLGTGALALGYVQRQGLFAKRWGLVPVMVVAEDMDPGSELTADKLAQRAIPPEFVTSSVVRPDAAASILHQRLVVPVQKGDLMLWTHVSGAEGARTGCAEPSQGLAGAPDGGAPTGASAESGRP